MAADKNAKEGGMPESQAWDHEITWDREGAEEWPLPLSADHLRRLRTPARLHGSLVRVVGLRPDGGSCWLAMEVGPDTVHVNEMFDPADDSTVSVRWGWAPPGAVERLPEFDGW